MRDTFFHYLRRQYATTLDLKCFCLTSCSHDGCTLLVKKHEHSFLKKWGHVVTTV